MRRFARLAVLLVVVAAVAVALWWFLHRSPQRTELTLYGNVDLREVNLPFNDNQRVARVLVQEGDHVRRGQVLAVLDTSRIVPLVAKARAEVEAQQQTLLRLQRGNRPEDIAQARSAMQAALANQANTKAQYARIQQLADRSEGRAVSRQDLDAARAAYQSAEAQLTSAQKALALQQIGPRAEDIAQAQAQLRGYQAELASAQQQLDDAELRAPLDTVVRSRLIEPGDMASPTQPAFTLAILDPKWVRAYVNEPDLGWIREGMPATVSVDSFADQRFSGWIGFISSMAEFTPKNVETTQLRSSLVYEVRVFVHDPRDQLRLGMPATVTLPLTGSAAGPAAPAPGPGAPETGDPAASASAPGAAAPGVAR